MSVLRAPDGLISFQCDECGEQLDTAYEDFSDAVMELREQGWEYHRDGTGQWRHYCDVECAA